MQSSTPLPLRRSAPLCYLAGAASLIFAWAWTRKYAELFGYSTPAVATSSAAFLVGLAAGGILSRRLEARYPERSRLGAGLIALAVWGSLSLPLADALAWLVFRLDRLLHPGSLLAFLAQSAVMLAAIVPPGALLGGALSSLAGPASESGRIRRFYTRFALGVAAGALLFGFVLLPFCGLLRSTLLASAALLVAGYASLTTANGKPAEPVPAPGASDFDVESFRMAFLAPRAAEVLLALTGFCSTYYLVIWARSLELILGDSVWSFAILLGTFCLGAAAGSAAAGAAISRLPVAAGLLFLVQPMAAILAVAGAALLPALPGWYVSLHNNLGNSTALFSLAQLPLCAAVLFLPALAAGMGLPLALEATRNSPAAEDTGWAGRLGGIHAAGGAAGALAAAVAISAWGLGRGFLAAVGVQFAAGIVVAAGAAGWTRSARWTAACASMLAGTLLIVAAPRWHPEEMTGGVYFYAPEVAAAGGLEAYRAAVAAGALASYRDGSTATVSVRRFPRGKVLSVNGFAEGSSASAAPILLGHLPFLLGSRNGTVPRRVLFLGLNTAAAAGAASLYPVSRIDVAEDEPALVEAATLFEEINGNVLEEPRVHVLSQDPRAALASAEPASYDLIVNQPADIWSPAGASRYSLEFYRLAASRLSRDGVMAQWLPLNRLDFEGVRSALATFSGVFPGSLAILVSRGSGELIVLGGSAGAAIEWARVERLFSDPSLAAAAVDLARFGWSGSGTLLERILLGPRELARLVEDAPLVTSGNGLLEFHALASERRGTRDSNLGRLYALACDPWVYVDGPPRGRARETPLLEMAAAALKDSDFARGPGYARQALEIQPSYAGYLVLGDLLTSRGDHAQALQAWNQALALHPQDPPVLFRLVRFYEGIDPQRRPRDYSLWVSELPPAYRPRQPDGESTGVDAP